MNENETQTPCPNVCPRCGEVHARPEPEAQSFSRLDIQSAMKPAIDKALEEKGIVQTVAHKRRIVRALLHMAFERALADGVNPFDLVSLLPEIVGKASKFTGKNFRMHIGSLMSAGPGAVVGLVRIEDKAYVPPAEAGEGDGDNE